MSDFIFMLTRADRTVDDAETHLHAALAAGVKHIGFKDIGLPLDRLAGLAQAIRKAGATVYLEVVSLDAQSEAASARAAIGLGVDVLMGGVRPEIVAPILAGSRIAYYPFPGRVVGYPSVLEGSADEIVASARRLIQYDGVTGLDLLAYRSACDAPDLISRVCAVAGGRPVVVAGSLDTPQRVGAAVASGASGFTVGTAALDAKFPASAALRDQISCILAARDEAMLRSRTEITHRV